MRRTFAGESQSTTVLKLTALSSRPGDEDEVLVLAAHPVLGLRGEALDRRAAEPADEVEVVRGEVLDDADVAHAAGERPDALGGDQEHLAELARPGRGGAARAARGCSARRSRRRRARRPRRRAR